VECVKRLNSLPLATNILARLARTEIKVREVGTLEARNSFSSLLERVERGEEITITRHGKPVAKLIPAEAARDIEKGRAAARGILQLRTTVMPDPEGLSTRDYIEMGRRY
jgi:prevent-host-death family protein